MDLKQQEAHLTELAQAYYEGTPKVSDEEFDALVKDYENAGGEWVVGHGYKVTTDRKVTHVTQMGSLDKENTREGLNSWIAKCERFYTDNCDTSAPLTFSISPKFDGLATAVTVKNGAVELVATRGDGFIGENVTKTALNIPSIQALASRGDGVYHGEVLLPAENLAVANELRFQAALEASPTPLPADQMALLTQEQREDAQDAHERALRAKVELKEVRNAAVGILRSLKDPKKIASTLVFADHNNGAWVETYTQDQLTVEKLDEVLGRFEALRTAYPVAEGKRVNIDGVVFKVENQDVRDGMGHGSRTPRWALAYKYQDVVYTSTVTGVEWGNPGKIGRITPVVEYAPIPIPGGIYTRATAHNLTRFKAMNVAIGDEVSIVKAGDVIPKVVKMTNKDGGEKLAILTECPSCGNPTSVDGEFLICTAPRTECDPVNALTLIITALGIKGIQEKVVRKIYDVHLSSTPDVYDALAAIRTMPKGEIANIEGLGEKTEEFLQNSLTEAWTNAPLSAWIYGLNVDRVGNSVSKSIERTYGTLEALIEAIDDESKTKPGKHLSGVNWAAIKRNRDKFVHLKNWMAEQGITVVAPTTTVQENEFWSGKKVAITGTLAGVKRPEAAAWLESQGATVQSSFSSSTDILIDAGDGTSTKSKKAREQNKAVVTGEQFMSEHYPSA